MKKDSQILILGSKGLVGSAIKRELVKLKYKNIIEVGGKSEYDLRIRKNVDDILDKHKPDYVFSCSAKVGGIIANKTYPAEFIYDNIMINSNIIDSCYKHGVLKMLNLGSSCIYPKNAEQPLSENSLLTSLLEPTNEPYAISKIAAIKMCNAYNTQYGTNFISVMPTNLYGLNDNYHPQNSHVIPGLIHKIYNAKRNKESHITLWGTGKPLREFLHSDDLSKACILLMRKYDCVDVGEFINIGSGQEYSISKIALIIKNIIGYEGLIYFDHENPDGTMRKVLDSKRIRDLGWKPEIDIVEGIKQVFKDYKKALKEI